MTEPLSIAYLNNFGGPTLGGGEVQLLALMRGVRDAGAQVTLACAAGSALESATREMGGVRVVPTDFDAARVTTLTRKLRAELNGVDLLQGTGFLTNLIARRVGPGIGARVINAVHVLPDAARLDGESAARSLLRTTLDRTSRSKVDRFVAVSSEVASGLEAQGVKRERIVVVPNGVNVAALREAAGIAPAQALAPATQRVGFAGRLETVKGCEFFIRAVALLAGSHPEARFFITGTGSLEPELRSLAAALGLTDRLDFLGHVDSLAPLLAASSVIVVPSLSEAFGLTAAEALALGVPVVASAVGGLPDIVVDGQTGLLVPASDAEAIAAAVSRLLDDAELARRLGAAGRERVSTRFTVERMVEGYLRVYEELAKG